jgi:hypothetical protein
MPHAKRTINMAGYSATPLVKKLGIKSGIKLYLVDAPVDYFEKVDPLPGKVTVVSRLTAGIDMAHLFSTDATHLEKVVKKVLPKLMPDGVIWVSWPKQASKVKTNITEDTIREIALPLGLVDIKVCAVDEVWSGLKLVIRKELRVK